MSEIGPWLVVGGAAGVIACVGAVLGIVLRVVRRRRAAVVDGRSARSAFADAARNGMQDDRLMPLLLRAAMEAARADAAVVTFAANGDRRRSYSAGLDVGEARASIDALGAARATAPTYRQAFPPLREGLVVPIERRGVSGVLAVYWRDEAPRELRTADLEELVASAFRPRPAPGDTVADALPPRPTDAADERARWSRLADLSRTLEPAPLLRKIVDAALADCGADAAAGRIRLAADQEPISEVRQFAEHERPWAESVLASEMVVPSITRYLARRREAAAGEGSIATAIVVPLRESDAEVIGNLVAVWRRDLADDADGKVADLERLVTDARPALGNASRFQRLQSLAVHDPSTGLFDQRYFLGFLARAVDEAHRTARPLALIAFAASEIEPGTHEVPVASLEQALVNGSARIVRAIGGLGVTCRTGLGEFAAIMPNADLSTARRLLDALMQELPLQAPHEAKLRWSASAAQLDDSESADELWQRARRELRPEQITRPRTRPERPVATPSTGGTVRLSLGGRGEDWRVRKPAPRKDAPGGSS